MMRALAAAPVRVALDFAIFWFPFSEREEGTPMLSCIRMQSNSDFGFLLRPQNAAQQRKITKERADIRTEL
jgi:hypothetical protein